MATATLQHDTAHAQLIDAARSALATLDTISRHGMLEMELPNEAARAAYAGSDHERAETMIDGMQVRLREALAKLD